MDRNFQRALPLVLRHEGGFVNNPHDPGGATNKGVTIASFRAYVKPGGTVADLKAITDDQVATVYFRHYWAAVNAPALPAGVDYALFDYAVNSGPSRAAKHLQAVVGARQDGKIGPATVAAVTKFGAARAINALCDRRMAFLKGLKTWSTFGKGWTRRVADVRAAALKMVGDPADVLTVEKPVTVEVPVDKPVVPVAVEERARKTTSWWQKVTGLFGAGGIGAALLAADWKVVAVVIGGVLVLLIVVTLFGRQIVAGVKDVRGAVEG